MKVRVGGNVGMKLMIFQYEPIDVSSTLEIEKEFEDEDKAQEWIEQQTEKINSSLKFDVETKAKIIAKNQTELRKKLKGMV